MCEVVSRVTRLTTNAPPTTVSVSFAVRYRVRAECTMNIYKTRWKERFWALA